jgi:hypothetical protein
MKLVMIFLSICLSLSHKKYGGSYSNCLGFSLGKSATFLLSEAPVTTTWTRQR